MKTTYRYRFPSFLHLLCFESGSAVSHLPFVLSCIMVSCVSEPLFLMLLAVPHGFVPCHFMIINDRGFFAACRPNSQHKEFISCFVKVKLKVLNDL